MAESPADAIQGFLKERMLTSAEGRQGRYERRKAKREAERDLKIGGFDSFDRIADSDNLNLSL
jgi:hypothetical protein